MFVREIESALIDGGIDVAVHSYKDLPSASPDGLVVAAVPERADPRDRLLILPAAYDSAAPLGLRPGVRVGTSSSRRRAFLAAVRNDLRFAHLRGNVPTRISKLRAGGMEAIVLASAGLDRLDAATGTDSPARRDDLVEVSIEVDVVVPAPAQGALALQCRADSEARACVEMLDVPEISACVRVERALLARVQGGCDLPFGAHCAPADHGRFRLLTALEVDGRVITAEGESDDGDELARTVWDRLQAATGDGHGGMT